MTEPGLPTPTSEVSLLLHLIDVHVRKLSGYLVAGLAVILIIAIGFQLRTARQLKRAMHDMNQILDLVEAFQAERLPEPALTSAPTAAIAPSAVVPAPASGLSLSFTPVERVVLDTIAGHEELHERELNQILVAKGFGGVLIKAVIADLVRKTATDGLPWVETRYAHGCFMYRLRGPARRARRDERWQG
jgi:hypothetical protein